MKKSYLVLHCVLIVLLASNICISQDPNVPNLNDQKTITGFLIPNGKPIESPKRIDAGESCVIDFIQLYSISGNISGSIEMNYRIIVYGKCGSPPGTYNEEWIAYGKFDGFLDGEKTSAKLSYTARVKIGGDVDGIMIFGQGLKAKLNISGNFKDGKLSYNGKIQ